MGQTCVAGDASQCAGTWEDGQCCMEGAWLCYDSTKIPLSSACPGQWTGQECCLEGEWQCVAGSESECAGKWMGTDCCVQKTTAPTPAPTVTPTVAPTQPLECTSTSTRKQNWCKQNCNNPQMECNSKCLNRCKVGTCPCMHERRLTAEATVKGGEAALLV